MTFDPCGVVPVCPANRWAIAHGYSCRVPLGLGAVAGKTNLCKTFKASALPAWVANQWSQRHRAERPPNRHQPVPPRAIDSVARSTHPISSLTTENMEEGLP